ncbi:major tail protein [Arthrobacter phage Amigo]|uniref:Major tail protein n=8 Tax=Amigovirus amigo TaxID=1982100 RepID=A0A5J6TF03_9CAUD|nr:major tail protein [Arthrobacter phage Amigo]ALY08478.1 hypothetical protein ANANSI_33 [Arthrobacter phage Anansi]ALY09092.1 hypothetical protein GORGEOUS_33 [Arthrobacter phage Gorgeous]ALY10373.1 hypothetical protein SORJUANA_33 [Arthrobacter phage SorJuana]QFG08327.1 hypothetical protein SEA_YEEZUS_32 [Arthrobacter phage Yeezus]QFG13375.1 hypothetical protein SEA_ICHOR_32 [Arthrobacter phage Ichor]QFG13893.1 hypothetical protein SEA_JAEK_32 [Arthrobacter phage Jaek]QJD51680.1 major tai
MAKMMSPNTTIWWVPLAGIANPMAPTVAEINAGTNISCAIVTGYTLGATASDTDDSKSICDDANVQTPTFDNYEASLTFFRSDLTAVTAIYQTAFNLFKTPRVEGYLVSRQGKKSDQVAASNDLVSVYRVISDSPQDLDAEGSAVQFTVPFLPQGVMNLNYKLV